MLSSNPSWVHKTIFYHNLEPSSFSLSPLRRQRSSGRTHSPFPLVPETMTLSHRTEEKDTQIQSTLYLGTVTRRSLFSTNREVEKGRDSSSSSRQTSLVPRDDPRPIPLLH